MKVAPFTGAWIEIMASKPRYLASISSHPSRVRGLKYCYSCDSHVRSGVAPFTGAWIEIDRKTPSAPPWRVAPFTGAWIEMPMLFMKIPPYFGRTLHGCVD